MPGLIVRSQATFWWTLTIVVAGAFFSLALSDAVDNFTAPPGAWHILLRKSYSLVAFAIVGYLFSNAQRASGRPKSALYIAGAVALYSALIEIAQAIVGAHEGLAWNAIDTAYGFVGGLLGNLTTRIRLRG